MKLTVIGGGSFGTAIAQNLSKNFDEVILLSRDLALVKHINTKHINDKYFPGVTLSKRILAQRLGDFRGIEDSDLVFFALPARIVRRVSKSLKCALTDRLVVTGAKGIEANTMLTTSAVLARETGNKNIISFSGPTFADEMLSGTSIHGATLGANRAYQGIAARMLQTGNLFLDYSDDVAGVEMAGVLKNIYSIGVGIFDSTHSSNNSHYLFMNLCYKEMTCILEKLSKDRELSRKFCAFGDFNLTANVNKSRNRTLGIMIGNRIIDTDRARGDIIYEGLNSIRSVESLCRSKGIEAPIITCIRNMVEDKPQNIGRHLHMFLKNEIGVQRF